MNRTSMLSRRYALCFQTTAHAGGQLAGRLYEVSLSEESLGGSLSLVSISRTNLYRFNLILLASRRNADHATPSIASIGIRATAEIPQTLSGNRSAGTSKKRMPGLMRAPFTVTSNSAELAGSRDVTMCERSPSQADLRLGRAYEPIAEARRGMACNTSRHRTYGLFEPFGGSGGLARACSTAAVYKVDAADISTICLGK